MAAQPKTVTLLDPNGQKVVVSSPADITNLVYGAGYKVEGKLTPDEAAALLAEQGPVADQLAQLSIATQATQTQTKTT